MMKPKFWYWSSSRTNDYHSITQIVMTPKLPSIIITPKTHGKNNVWKRKMFVQPLAFACWWRTDAKNVLNFLHFILYFNNTNNTWTDISILSFIFFPVNSRESTNLLTLMLDAMLYLLLSGIATYVDIYVRYIFRSYPYMIHCFSCRWWNVKVWHELDANVTHSSHNNTTTTEFECTHYIGSGNNN